MMDFVDELHIWQEIATAGEPEHCGTIEIDARFPDPEDLLDSAYAFLQRLRSFPLKVTLRQQETSVFEEYIFETAPGSCTISANDTEGIRRGIYKVGELLRQYPAHELPVQKQTFRPFMKTRISRYRFGSDKYPGTKFELAPDADFYPEAFLDRFASEGINAVWFNIPRIEQFCLTDWTPGDAEKKERYYVKLQENVDRCRKYGIRIFPYAVVPQCVKNDDPLLEKHPGLQGPQISGRVFFCPAFEGKQYLYDMFHQLFSRIRHLGGFLAIVQGEGAGVCPEFLKYGPIPCQDKCKLQPAEVFATQLKAMYDGMHDATPEAELFAWYYLPFVKDPADYLEQMMALAPKGIVFQYNAESGAAPVQLGKPRPIADYWQAYTDAAPAFRKFAGMAKRQQQRLSAKIQVGTSHEIGSVPYIPAPGLTYRKYKVLQEVGATDVMQVWGTGGTPGLMNYAAGRLAFTDCSKVTEHEFLLELGADLWGREYAPVVAEAWRKLSDAFEQNYPYSNMVQYYGPVADGVTWPLHAYPVDRILLPTWVDDQERFSGDNLCVCLNNHSFDEMVLLFTRLHEQWKEGTDLLRSVAKAKTLSAQQQRDLVRTEALEIIFGCAKHIFRFYQLRLQSFRERSTAYVAEMRQIVLNEITARQKLLGLIEQDPVLGYNPEARGYKFNPPKITKSIQFLQNTLVDLDRLASGDFTPLYEQKSAVLDGKEIRTEKICWSGIIEDGVVKIHAHFPGHAPIYDEMFYVFDNNGKDSPISGHADHLGRIQYSAPCVKWTIQDHEDHWEADLSVPVDKLPGGSLDNCRFAIMRFMDTYDTGYTWPDTDPIVPPRDGYITQSFYNPHNMGFLYKPS